MVVPDNVLFEENAGTSVRRALMDKCDLHTVLRLPTGIFYAQGVKTNVLFFEKGEGKRDKANTKTVWFYDARTNAPAFGKRTPLTRQYFDEFVGCFGQAKRRDSGEAGRWRRFERGEIEKRGNNLDVTWLKDEGLGSGDEVGDPEVIAAEILEQLRVAMGEIEALQEELGE